jgi:hypothetical protein
LIGIVGHVAVVDDLAVAVVVSVIGRILWAWVAEVSELIGVGVGLGLVGDGRAIVTGIRHIVEIGVSKPSTERPDLLGHTLVIHGALINAVFFAM